MKSDCLCFGGFELIMMGIVSGLNNMNLVFQMSQLCISSVHDLLMMC